ncbi:MAG: hypothetical protein DRN17_03260 [Thermoplasmata archaeon]|nr:MAG: hypothetical protein DRN17_03260 [Thermoplasmata archaeon]
MSTSALRAELDKIIKIAYSGVTEAEDKSLDIRPHILDLDPEFLRESFGLNKHELSLVYTAAHDKLNSFKIPGLSASEFERYDHMLWADFKTRKAIVFTSKDDATNFSRSQIFVTHIQKRVNEYRASKGRDPMPLAQAGHHFSARSVNARHQRMFGVSAADTSGLSPRGRNLYKKFEAQAQTEYKERVQAIYNEHLHKAGAGKAMYKQYKTLLGRVGLEATNAVVIQMQPKHLNEHILGLLEKKYRLIFKQYVEEERSRLLTLKGSPSIWQMVVNALGHLFLAKNVHTKPVGKPPTKLKDVYKSSASKKINANLKGKVHTPIMHTIDLSNAEGGASIPSDLLMLLNQRISGTVADNMGDGTADGVLNYQTGRFSESVEIQAVRATSNRANHVLIFYDYMKYPYQTFDPGWAQYRSDRRGPKQIIDQSIRELAAQLTYNKFAITPVLR